MKKQMVVIILLAVLVFSCLALTACHEHEFGEWTVKTPATCTQAGQEQRVCSCGEKETRDSSLAEHTYGEWTVVNAPTCIEAGLELRYCSCGATQTRVVEATGHSYTSVVTNPTCTEQGYTTHTCHCGDGYVDTYVDATGHSYTSVVTSPTCTEQGYTTHTCDCGYSYVDTYVDALGHDEVPHDAKVPTCTEIGWNAYVTCSRCDYTTYVEIPATGHSFGEWTVVEDATCTELGQEERVCACGEKETRDISLAEHTYVNNVCSVCGDVYYSKGLGYTLSDDETYYIVSDIGTCTDTKIVIPSIYNEKPVLGIGGVGFNSCDSIISVMIPEGVTVIADYAFAYCSNLTSITLPNSLTSIGEYAFSNCDKLKTVTINDTITSIGMGAFAYCPIETATIPTIAITNVTNSCLKTVIITSGDSIGEYAFCNCDNLISVTISNSVTAIGNHAFSDCDKLETISIPSSVITIGDHAFGYCRSLESINIPQGVTTIGSHVLSGCDSLKSITIPNTVTSIGDDAFYSCNTLTSVVIPDSVVTIGENAFNDCGSLKNITIGKGVTYIGSSAFWGCPIETASIPTIAIPNLAQNAYLLQSTLKTLEITGGDTIGNGAFENFASLTSVSFSESVKNIGDSAFAYCENLANIEFEAENQLERIGEYAFMRCKGLTTVVIAEGTKPLTIGAYAFANCNISSITIPSNAVVVANKALKDCAFIIVNEGNSVYTSIDGNLYADNGSTLVQYATGKRETVFEIPSGVRKIESYAFMNSQNLVSVTIPTSVTSIGVSAFEYCDRLSSITFEDPTGWYVTQTQGASSGTNLTLTSATQNATYLKSTYEYYYWYKSN